MLLPLGEKQRMLSCHMISFLLSFALTADISHKCLLYYLPVIVFCIGNSPWNLCPHASKVVHLLYVNFSLFSVPWGLFIHLTILANSGSLNYTAYETRPLFNCLGLEWAETWVLFLNLPSKHFCHLAHFAHCPANSLVTILCLISGFIIFKQCHVSGLGQYLRAP